jgi:hypothetical protein
LARQFYGVPLSENSIHAINAPWSKELSSVYLQEFYVENIPTEKVLECFPWLAERMVHLLETMENWKPKTFGELFIPGYMDRTSWWIAMFGIFFGFMSVLLVVLSGYQIYLGQRALYLSQQQINVALQAFQLQFNTTTTV